MLVRSCFLNTGTRVGKNVSGVLLVHKKRITRSAARARFCFLVAINLLGLQGVPPNPTQRLECHGSRTNMSRGAANKRTRNDYEDSLEQSSTSGSGSSIGRICDTKLAGMSVDEVNDMQREHPCKSEDEARELCNFLVRWKKACATEELPCLHPEMLRRLDKEHVLKLKDSGLVAKEITLWFKFWDEDDFDADSPLSAAQQAAEALLTSSSGGAELTMEREPALEICIENYEPFMCSGGLFDGIRIELRRWCARKKGSDPWMSRRALEVIHVPELSPCGQFQQRNIVDWRAGLVNDKWVISEGIGSEGCNMVYVSFAKRKQTRQRKLGPK